MFENKMYLTIKIGTDQSRLSGVRLHLLQSIVPSYEVGILSSTGRVVVA